MVEYGFINKDGYLRTKQLEEYFERYQEKGIIKTRKVSIEKQAKTLSVAGWKPVDVIEDAKLQAPDGYIIRMIPYDAGDKISFKYEQVIDIQKIRRDIENMKNLLASSDYKIIKCYEAYLMDSEMPYDIKALHKQRQELRDRINSLQRENNL